MAEQFVVPTFMESGHIAVSQSQISWLWQTDDGNWFKYSLFCLGKDPSEIGEAQSDVSEPVWELDGN